MRNTEFFDIFCGLTGLKKVKSLDQYYKQHYAIDFGHKLFTENKDLPLNKRLQAKLEHEATHNNITKLDFISLFYISYFDLSSECRNHLNNH